MVMTIVVMGGLGSLNTANAAAQAGDLIKMDGLSSVYYLGNDGKRYVFPSESVYFSWYQDFSSVVTIPASELQSYPLGANVTMRPGTKLVKITTDPSVYAVTPNGVLRKIASESDAITLFGTNWSKMVVDVADAFFTNYTVGTPLTTGTYPAGTLLKNANNASIYYFDGTDYRMIASEAAFTANRFSWNNVITTSMTLTASGSSVTGAETFAQPTGATSGPIVTGSGLTAALSASTPASQNIPEGSQAEFLKINLTAANDGAVNVTSIKLTAYGLSTATDIDDAAFYDNGIRLGSSKGITSDRIAVFNFASPIYVAAGTTKTLVVKATVNNLTSSGSYGLGIAAAADIMSSAAAVTGSFPITGNVMSVVDADLGEITIIDSPVSDTVSFGEDDILLSEFTVEADGDDALVESIRLYNAGTNSADIVSNLKLYADGDEVATGSYVDRYVTFNVNNFMIEDGDSITFEVKGDMGITNAGDEISLYLKSDDDFTALGKTHGFAMALDNQFSTVLSTIELSAGDFTIDMDKSATPAKDVKAGDDNVVLATIVLKSNGENATINEIVGDGKFFVDASATTDLENFELVDKTNGGIYDLDATFDDGNTQFELDLEEEISLTKGIAKTLELRADVTDTVSENDTFKATLFGTALDIEGDVSGEVINDITPSSVSGALISVEDASLTLTPVVMTDVNAVGGTSETIVYKAMLEAGSASDIKLQAVTLEDSTGGAAFADANITKLDLYLNGKLLKSLSNKINETGDSITFNSLDSSYYTIPAGQEVALEVKASFASTVTAGTFNLMVAADADVEARTADGNNDIVAVDTAATPSREVNLVAKGTLNVALLTVDAKANKNSFLLAGSETEAGRYLGEVKFTTANESVEVNTLTLTNGGTADNADIKSVKLVKADGTLVAEKTVASDGDVTFDPFDVTFPADQSTSLFIVAVAKGMNVDGDATATATSGTTLSYTLGAITATGADSGEDITESTTGTGSSKTATVVGSKLNSVVNNLTDGTLVGGTSKTLAKYTFTFENGSNREANNDELKADLQNLVLTVSKAEDVVITNAKLYIEGSSEKADGVAASLGATSASGTITWNAAALNSLTDGARIDGTVTLVVSADVAPTAADSEYVQTSIADVNGLAATDDLTYSSSGVTHSLMNLPVTEVVGATLSE